MPPVPNPELEALMLDTAPRVPLTPPVGEDESPTLAVVRQISEMRNQRNIAYRRRLKEVATNYLVEKRRREEAQAQARTLRNETDALRLRVAQLQRAAQTLEAARTAAVEQATAAANRTPVDEQLRLLQETAVVWRDAANGTSAKLSAFRNFCAVLDSLPAAQQAPAQQEAPQPF